MPRKKSTTTFTIKDFHSAVNRLNHGGNIKGIVKKLNHDVLTEIQEAITTDVLASALKKKEAEELKKQQAASRGKMKKTARVVKDYMVSTGRADVVITMEHLKELISEANSLK
jgi:hypothetical protein